MDIQVHIDPRHAWWQNLLEESATKLAKSQITLPKFKIELEDVPDRHEQNFKFRVTNSEPYRCSRGKARP